MSGHRADPSLCAKNGHQEPTYFLAFPNILLGALKRRGYPWCYYCVEPFKLCGVQTAIVRIRMPLSTAMRAEHLCRWGAPMAAPNRTNAKFCNACGTALGPQVVPPDEADAPQPLDLAFALGTAVEPQAVPEGERKMVTALFVDIMGSTELGQHFDPEEARAIIDPALALMIDAVRRYDGYVVQSTGDGIFALFGAPVAREDHPQRTLYTAMRMQDEIRRYSGRLRAEGRPPI